MVVFYRRRKPNEKGPFWVEIPYESPNKERRKKIMSRQGNVSIKAKEYYRNKYSKKEIDFARQFGYEKAIYLQSLWRRAGRPKVKNFKLIAEEHGYTDYIIKAFVVTKRRKK